jgi:hypothetical protein
MTDGTETAAPPTWFDSSTLARRFRQARQREGWAIVAAGVIVAVFGIYGIVERSHIGVPATVILSLVLFAVATLMVVVGQRGIVQNHYLAGVKVDDDGVHMRFLEGADRVAGWSGISLELVSLALPPNPLLGKEAAAAAASWMLWLQGKCIGDVSAAAVDAMVTGARARTVNVEQVAGPWRGFRMATVVRIGAR